MPTSYENKISSLNPTVWLKLDSSTATDSGTAGLSLTTNGSPTTGVSGISNTGWTLSGSESITTSTSLPTNTFNDKIFSIEFWMKIPNNTSNQYQNIWQSSNAGLGHYMWMRYRNSTLSSPGTMEVYLDGGSAVANFYSTIRVDDNNWHHIVFTTNASSQHKLYIDGVLNTTNSTNVGTVTLDASGITFLDSYQGTVDEIALYTTELNAPQIYNNHIIGRDANSMQSYILGKSPEYFWQGDPVDASTVTWYTGGSGTDSTTWTRTTVSGSNIARVASTLPTSYSGSYMLSIPTSSRYRTGATVYSSTELTDGDFTAGVWFKQNTSSSNATALTWILGITSNIFNMSMRSSTATTAPGCVFWTAAGNATNGTIRVDDGDWHFLAIRKVSGNNTYSCYVDGVLDTTITTSSALSAGNVQVGDSTQGSGSATIYVDNFFFANSSNVNATDILQIYEHAFPANVNININETPATASALFPDASVTGETSISYGANPATASAELVTPALSFTQDLDWFATAFTASTDPIIDPVIITEVNTTADPMTASADDVAPGLIIDDGYNALVATADAGFDMVAPVITTEQSAIVMATPLTADATSGSHQRYIRTINVDISGDRMRQGSTGAWDPEDFPNLRFENLAGSGVGKEPDKVFMTTDTFISNLTNNVISANLILTTNVYYAGTYDIQISRNTSSWTEPSTTLPTSTIFATRTITLPAVTSNFALNITDLVKDWVNGVYPNYGVTLENITDNSAGWRVDSTESTTVAYRPYIQVTADFGLDDANFDAPPATASALMTDPNIIEGIGYEFAAEPALSSALFVNPATSAGFGPDVAGGPFIAFGEAIAEPVITSDDSYEFVQSNGLTATAEFPHPITVAEGAELIVDVSPWTASASMPLPTVSIPETVGSDPMYILNAELVDPTLITDFNRIIYAGAFSAGITLLDPLEAILEQDDPYYQEIIKTTNLYDGEWFRLDEISGSTVISKTKELNAANLQNNGTFINTPVFGGVGPRNRKVIGFTGSQYIEIPHTFGATGSSGNFDWLGAAATQTVEFVIKTTSATGTLLDGEDANTLVSPSNPLGWTLDLVGGKLRYRRWASASGTRYVPVGGMVTGFKAINDGEWHHIVIQIGNTLNGKQLEIFIDGDLDIARFNTANVPIMAHPDRLFGNSVTTMNWAYDTTGGVPGSAEFMPNFTGEVMEYVMRPNISLTEYQIEQLFYAALDIDVEKVDRWTATAEMPEPFVSGNKPRALMLSFWPYEDYKDTNQFAPPFDEYPGYTRRKVGGFAPEAYDVWEYYVNRVSARPQITRTNTSPGVAGVHRDPVTDEVRLLDPRTIKNIDKFDIIQINGYPLDSNDINNIFAGYNEEKGYQFALKALETFVEQVREIVDEYGTSLLVLNPRLAADLGIIDDVEYTNSFFERTFTGLQSAHNSGFFDPRSAQIALQDDFNNLPDISTVDGNSWFDNTRNNRLRIVATEAGLTDIQGGWTLEYGVSRRPRDILTIERSSYRYKDTRNGLQIGDEMQIVNQQVSGFGVDRNLPFTSTAAEDPIIAFPPDSIKAGTVIATLGSTYWSGTQERVNPYSNYAAAIIVKPGENLKGKTLGGKIFVNCAEQIDTSYANMAVFQITGFAENGDPIIPGNSTWQYSQERLSLVGTATGISSDQGTGTAVQGKTGTSLQAVTDAGGNTYLVPTSSAQIFALIINEIYDTTAVWSPSLLERGILWLGVRVVPNPNDSTIRPQAFVAEALMKNSGLNVNKDNVKSVTAMIATARILEAQGIIPVDTNNPVLPMTASATISGLSKDIAADPMTATAILNTNLVTFAGGEQVVVTLHETTEIDLYIKENA